MGRGLTSGGQGLCLVQLCAKACKRYIESLPLVPKDKRSCFSQGERSAVQLPLDHAYALLEVGRHLETICTAKIGAALPCRFVYAVKATVKFSEISHVCQINKTCMHGPTKLLPKSPT